MAPCKSPAARMPSAGSCGCVQSCSAGASTAGLLASSIMQSGAASACPPLATDLLRGAAVLLSLALVSPSSTTTSSGAFAGSAARVLAREGTAASGAAVGICDAADVQLALPGACSCTAAGGSLSLEGRQSSAASASSTSHGNGLRSFTSSCSACPSACRLSISSEGLHVDNGGALLALGLPSAKGPARGCVPTERGVSVAGARPVAPSPVPLEPMHDVAAGATQDSARRGALRGSRFCRSDTPSSAVPCERVWRFRRTPSDENRRCSV